MRLVAFGAGMVVGAAGLYTCIRAEHVFPRIVSAHENAMPPAIVAPIVMAPPRTAGDIQRLVQRDLSSPISGVKASDLRDTFSSPRPGRKTHEAIDIPAPRGTPIHAISDGVISRLFVSAKGGITIYQVDSDSVYCFYYAHLSRYANRLHQGMTVKHGDVIGYVGTSGDAPPNGPHLHFSITRLGAEGSWMEGAPVNPYPLLAAICPDGNENTN